MSSYARISLCRAPLQTKDRRRFILLNTTFLWCSVLKKSEDDVM